MTKTKKPTNNITFSKKIIDVLAEEYAEDVNSGFGGGNTYHSDYISFVNGFEKAVETINGKIIE